ncbi:VanW family protein, partial [candidate division WWE3 bacterium]|nr:VanW family protein [candidate division WWE3 bacterium]
GEVFTVNGGKVVEFRSKTDGRQLDKEKFVKDFSRALLSGSKEVLLLVEEVRAPGDVNKYGIYALLGEGVSYFTGSIPARIKNLTLAAERSSGVLLAPGEIYSFNKSVGDISKETGYDYAYIIENGRTVLGEGGGVCQTSTTLFRAALNAGLPIVKRSAHAYRVQYYEIKSEVGLDATVYNPTVDLQFKNDTPGYILVQADWDLNQQMLRFRIYGTPDGRVVELSKPVITNVSPPPDPVYQDDPELKKGVVKQIDFPAWGAQASVTRIVKRGEEVLREETFVSRYQPWRAVFLKGTKED